MKNILLLLACLIALGTTYSQNVGYPDFEIVESIPIETNLDNPDIRNTSKVWLEMINNAKSSIDIEQFYISNQKGEPLEDILEAIIKAGDRDVKVRVVVDSRMYKTYPESVDILGKKKNISVRIIDFGKLAGGIQHAKYFIVDSEEIFLGSQNFDWRALKHIHEIGVRIRHTELVKIYQDIFNLDWQLADRNDPSLIKSILQSIQYHIPFKIVEGVNDTLTLIPTMSPKGLINDTLLWDEKNIVELIDRATKNVYCQVLTYSPEERSGKYYSALDNSLRRAAARGVTVNMIVSDWSIGKPVIDHLKNLASVANIQVKFSTIPEWTGGYIPYARVEHCKFLVVDGIHSWIGTSNWEKSYFYTSRNLGVVVLNKNISEKLQKIFLKSWDGSYSELIKPDIEYRPRKHGE